VRFLSISKEEPNRDNIALGTSGWSYEEWVGPFYVKREKMFSEYARVFKTAEINSTFYSYPNRGMVYGLTRGSPSDFVFAAKLPKLITHTKKLDPDKGVKADLDRFLELMKPMKDAGKLGPILIQLPPGFSYNKKDSLQEFLGLLPKDHEFAVEFRNLSWLRDETWELLRKYNVAYTIVDEPLLPPKAVFTADFAYIRWHGKHTRPWFNYRYSEEELDNWVPKVKEAAQKTKKVYGYFNNHFHGYAPENCVQMLEKLGKATRLQTKVKKAIQDYIAGKQTKLPMDEAPQTPKEAEKLGLSQLLRKFTDAGRIDRAETIRKSSVSFKEATEKLVSARVKEYEVHIDPASRTIRHSCGDWARQYPEKKICKHIVRVFLSLPLELSKKILTDMVVNKESWQFQPLDK
jgi:uncharacterized protein YecE (DUF72 family)